MTGAGVSEMLDEVRRRLAERVAGAGLVTRKRQADALEDALAVLAVRKGQPAELLAEAVRRASHRLSEVVGKIAPDDYLDEIFSRFCIGK